MAVNATQRLLGIKRHVANAKQKLDELKRECEAQVDGHGTAINNEEIDLNWYQPLFTQFEEEILLDEVEAKELDEKATEKSDIALTYDRKSVEHTENVKMGVGIAGGAVTLGFAVTVMTGEKRTGIKNHYNGCRFFLSYVYIK